MKIYVIAALGLSLALNVYQYKLTPKTASVVLADSFQAECIRRMQFTLDEVKVIGPPYLSGYKALYLSMASEADFNKELSGCFYDRYVEGVTVENLAEKVHFMRSTGIHNITFFKGASTDEFTVYGQGKG